MAARGKRTTAPTEALGAELEATLRQVVQDYHAFVQAGPNGDPKTFTAYHAACRAALAHIDQLVKLLSEATEPGDSAKQDREELLAKTRADMAAAGEEEEGDA
jgi:hypothetical protein